MSSLTELLTSAPPAPAGGHTVKSFLESVHPGKSVDIESLATWSAKDQQWHMDIPDLQLHCASKYCQGVRFFESRDTLSLAGGMLKETFLTYMCRNCEWAFKTFALRITRAKEGGKGTIFKFGEEPLFGPPTPPRVITLIGDEKDYFLKGRRAELQGLGVAAFAYYRRVVENRKNQIIDEILRVAKKGGASIDTLDELARARAETQFSTAVDAIRHGVPQSLLIDGHNPLSLLHAALSEGLHANTDEECLQLATNIRVVLFDLVDRMAVALKDDAELSRAVSKLLEVKNPQARIGRQARVSGVPTDEEGGAS